MTEYKTTGQQEFKTKEFKELYDSLWRTIAINESIRGKNKTERLEKETINNFIRGLYDTMHKIENRIEIQETAGRCNPDGSLR
jgi:hypothetical protein